MANSTDQLLQPLPSDPKLASKAIANQHELDKLRHLSDTRIAEAGVIGKYLGIGHNAQLNGAWLAIAFCLVSYVVLAYFKIDDKVLQAIINFGLTCLGYILGKSSKGSSKESAE